MSVATERKLVTVLFCDLVGSTALGERLEVEALQIVQTAYFDRMRAVVEQFGGTVEKFAGDAVVAVFGVPAQHEDDAARAVRCALGLREALGGLNDTVRPRFGVELDLRVGVVTGEAVVGGADALATGDVMNTAARLEQAAGPGQILAGRETMLLTADAVDYGEEVAVEAKGKRDPVRAWPALQVAAGRSRARSPLVGRAAELELLASAVEDAIARNEPQAVVVLGEPGIGKSRLAEEFGRRTSGRATVLRGACAPYGEGSVWQALAEVVRQEVGDDAVTLRRVLERRHAADERAAVEAQLAVLTGASAGRLVTGELLWALRRYLEELARESPAVIVLDDLHWADNALLDALRDVLGSAGRVPLTVVLQGRPELRERLADLASARIVELGELSPDEAAALIDNLGAWTAELRTAIVERGEGSPLFIEEIAAMADEDGIDAGVPRSLRALIGARLDLFEPETKRAAQAAAVVGDVFWEGAIADGGTAADALSRLRATGFVDEDPGSSFRGERQFRFHHALIREVAYASLPKLERARLHRRSAEWLEQRERRPELVLQVARHLERAVSLQREVAPFEAVEPSLVRAAVDALRSAASWSAASASVSQATELLQSAVHVAADDEATADLAMAQLAAVQARSGSAGEAVELAGQVLERGATPEATALASLALAEAARARFDPHAMLAAGTRALEAAEPLGLLSVQVEAHDIVGLAENWSGRLSSSVEHRLRATEIARELGDLPRVAFCMAGHSVISQMELGRIDDADHQAGEALRLAEETGSLRAIEASHSALVFVRRAQDRFDEALHHARERVRIAEELGEAIWIFNGLVVNLARTLIELERFDEASAALERGLEVSAASGIPDDDAHAGLAFIAIRRGRLEEAEAEIAFLPSPERYDELALLREAQGRIAEADEIWQGMLADLAGSEAVVERAEKNVEYARFLAGQGRSDRARAHLSDARALVAGTGAAYVERLAGEVEALL